MDKPAASIDAKQRLVRACRLAEQCDGAVSVGQMAEEAGYSLGHFQRLFRRFVGIAPGEFIRSRRTERFSELLRSGLNVTEAALEAGFSSSSRSHQAAGEGLGMPPSKYRHGGAGEKIGYATGPCSLGQVLVAATGRGLCAVLLGNDPGTLVTELGRRFPAALIEPGNRDFRRTLKRVIALIDRPRTGAVDLPLDLRGTAFQRRVWAALEKIPAGERITYGELARRMGAPDSARAVAAACGANPLAVVIPCHRVVRADGGPGGYRWGIDRKKELLRREELAGL